MRYISKERVLGGWKLLTGYCCKERLYEVMPMLRGCSSSYLRWKGMLFQSDET
jgi:hypothetical protein